MRLTVEKIKKLEGEFIVMFELDCRIDYQFKVSKEELISELETNRTPRPETFEVQSCGAAPAKWHTIFIRE